MRKKRIVLTLLIALCGVLASAQNLQVSGVVTSQDGEPVPFASVVLKGTTTGTATDALGNYSISAPSNGTLVFSSIGFTTQEAQVGGRKVINIILAPDTEFLDDVIVVAYGTAKRESVTGAVSTVRSESIEKRPVSSVTDILDGRVTGVMVNSTYGAPGSDAEISIRGFGSINGNNDPLYVVDGVPFGGNVSDLNPNDIESITVLKDATSAALYGNRASNGVILITTKRGKSDKVTMNVSVNQGFYSRGIPEYDKVDAYGFMQTYFDGYSNYLMGSNPTKYPTRDLAIADTRDNLMTLLGNYNVFNVADTDLFDANGKFNPNAKIREGFNDLNWFKAVERVGYRQEYNVSGQGASDKSNYYFSVGYLDEQGQIDYSSFNRITGRANVTLTPVKWLKAGLNTGLSVQSSDGISTGTSTIVNPLYFARVIAPIYPIYLHDMNTGEFILDDKGNKQYDDGVEYSRMQHVGRHAIWENELDVRKTTRITNNVQAFVDIMFLKDFTLSIKGDIGIRDYKYQSYGNSTLGDSKGYPGSASIENYLYKFYTFQQLLNWRHEFGDHTVEALAGHENYQYGYDYEYGRKQGETFTYGTKLNNFTDITSLTGYYSGYRLESYLARVKYDYLSKYFAEASFRRDGSSRFYSDNRWGNFWSVGATWIISKEDFMSDVNWVENLKMRASFGQVGNDRSVGYYAYKSLYSMQKYGGQLASYMTQLESKDLVWESANSLSVALEGRLFDRWNLSLELFDKTTHNLLFDVALPLSAGGTDTSSATAEIAKNIGSARNRGIEVNTDVDVIRTKDFNWNIGLSLTSFKNKILTLPEENRKDGIVKTYRKLMEGHGIYDYWLYQYVGIDQMNGRALYLPDFDKYYIGEEEEGKTEVPAEWVSDINGEKYVYNSTYAKKDWSGSAIPKVYGSFNTSLNYKNLSVSALFTWALGGKVFDSGYQNLLSMTTTPRSYHVDVLKGWTEAPAGMTETSADRISKTAMPANDFYWNSYSTATSSRFLFSGNYLVVKNIAVSYKLPRKVCQSIGLSGISFSAAIDNLWSFTAMKGLNPQQSFDGVIDNYFNTPRVGTLGIKVTL
ncbi:MAG: SusC/RagA family TonB-linked outer membrane protein [Bacteroidales bacterium]|nr:SusC/RagA family TonB-linked outer membrane protein [Bacteroidales bacterium]